MKCLQRRCSWLSSSCYFVYDEINVYVKPLESDNHIKYRFSLGYVITETDWCKQCFHNWNLPWIAIYKFTFSLEFPVPISVHLRIYTTDGCSTKEVDEILAHICMKQLHPL